MNPIELVAHRGYCRQYPENTLLSLAAAIQAGARYIETDLQLSSDQVPVLYHDRHMKRISDHPGAIHHYPFDELIKLPAHEPQRFGDRFIDQKITPLADLVQLLQANPGVQAFIEVKRCAIRHHGSELLYQRLSELLRPIAQRIVLISFSLPFVDYSRRAGWPRCGLILRHWSERHQTPVTRLRPEFIFCDYNLLPKKEAIAIGWSRLVVYEIDDPQQAIDLHERGADMIETFAVAELMRSLHKRFDIPV